MAPLTPGAGRTERAGVELVFHEWPGDPPPALLLHGIANYGRYWDLFASEVAGRLRLVATDARGHGASGRPPEGYAPADFVADALAVLDALAVDRALVVAHSMGGTHAMRLAADHPDRVRGLVLVDVGPADLREGAERARRLTTERPASFAGRAAAEAYLRRTSPGYSDEVYANRLDHAFRVGDRGELVWRSDPAALVRIREARSSQDERWDQLRRARCPLLVVRGTRSNVLARETAERMTRETGAALLELDAGHNVPLDRPRELAEAVVRLSRSL